MNGLSSTVLPHALMMRYFRLRQEHGRTVIGPLWPAHKPGFWRLGHTGHALSSYEQARIVTAAELAAALDAAERPRLRRVA